MRLDSSPQTHLLEAKAGFFGSFLIIVAVFFAYFPTRFNSYVPIDDWGYIVANPMVNQGLSWRSVTWAFSTFEMNNWHPLTWLSHQVDVSLFGIRPGAHHQISVLFHMLNALLMFAASRRFVNWQPALFSAFLFGVHPIHVESVAWVSERKDVLSLLFLWPCLFAWYRYVSGKGRRYFGLAILFHALSLMAKPTAVTLPALLLLLDLFLFKRSEHVKWSFLVLEKLPMAVSSALSALLTLLAQAQLGGISASAEVGLGARVLNASWAYWQYVRRWLLPYDLSPHYPFETRGLMIKGVVGILLLAIIFWVFSRLRWSLPMFGLLWMLVALLPMIGLIKVGDLSMADRYAYIPHLGLYFGLASILNRFDRQRFLWGICWLLALGFGALCLRQTLVWRDADSYYKAILRHDPSSTRVRAALASQYLSFGDLKAAEANLLCIPDGQHSARSLILLARVKLKIGERAEAKAWYTRAAAQQHPLAAVALGELGDLLMAEGELGSARNAFEKSAALMPELGVGLAGLVEWYRKTNQPEDAERVAQQLATLPPMDYIMKPFLKGSPLLARWKSLATHYSR